MADTSFLEQVRRNQVALISLIVAITSLAYSTWRNEQTEANRNVRASGFELLVTLGELQQIVFFSHYDRDAARGNPRAGWTRVLVMEDLAALMPADVGQSTAALKQAWSRDWEGLGRDDAAAARVSAAIDEARMSTLAALRALD